MAACAMALARLQHGAGDLMPLAFSEAQIRTE
jgi:hypothetical protein